MDAGFIFPIRSGLLPAVPRWASGVHLGRRGRPQHRGRRRGKEQQVSKKRPAPPDPTSRNPPLLPMGDPRGMTPGMETIMEATSALPPPKAGTLDAAIDDYYERADPALRRVLRMVARLVDAAEDSGTRTAYATVLRDAVRAVWTALPNGHVYRELDAVLARLAPDWPRVRPALTEAQKQALFPVKMSVDGMSHDATRACRARCLRAEGAPAVRET